MGTLASQITFLTVVYSTVYSAADQKISKLRDTSLCAGNSPVTGEFPVQMASNAENVSIWGRHHDNLCAQSSANVSKQIGFNHSIFVIDEFSRNI